MTIPPPRHPRRNSPPVPTNPRIRQPAQPLMMLIDRHYQIVQLEKKGEVADYQLLLEKTL
nr:hypothetical protein [Serratia proteamaculans]